MKLRMTNIHHNVEETEWGTCDLCMGSADFDFVEYEITPDDGREPYWIEGFYFEPWDGPYHYEIENIPRFAGWLQEQEFPDGFILTPEHLPALAYAEMKGSNAQEGLDWFNKHTRRLM